VRRLAELERDCNDQRAGGEREHPVVSPFGGVRKQGLWIWFMRRAGAAGGGMFSFGRAKPRQYEPTKERVSFDDVAGIDEAEQELAEVVDFLRDPSKYRRLGAASRVACS
jgi:ATP-dependent Zn protease